MKKTSVKILSFLFAFMLVCFSFAGCKSKKNDDNKSMTMTTTQNITETVGATDEATKSKKEMADIKKSAEEDVEKADGVTESKIKEAVDYIETNLVEPADKISEDTAKKIAYYGAYLNAVGKKDAQLAKHDLAMYGNHVYMYMSNIYTKSDDVGSEASKKLKENIDKSKETVKGSKDKLVSELNTLFHAK